MHLVIKLISSPLFWVDVVLAVSGAIIVWWGLKIEREAERLLVPLDFKPDIFGDVIEPYKAKIEHGWRILMFGIIVEAVAAFVISVISGLEIADANDQAEKARKEAGVAMKEAAGFNERSKQLEATNLAMRASVASLETAVRELAHLYDQSTNALAEAKARLATIKPAKERLIDFLNALNPDILKNLKTQAFVHCSGQVKKRTYNELEGLSQETGSREFIRNFIPSTSISLISTGDPRSSGEFANLNFEVLHSLLE